MITVAPIPADIPEYDRGDWKHWVDADGDCQAVRHEVLIAESLVEVTFKTDKGARSPPAGGTGFLTDTTWKTLATWMSTTWPP